MAALSLFARWLGPDGYAWFALASAGSAICVAVLLQPLQQSLARFLPGSDGPDLTATLARLMIMVIAAALSIAVGIELIGSGAIPRGLAIAAWALGSSQALFDFAGKYTSTQLMPGRFAAMYLVKATLVLVVGLLLSQRVDEGAIAVGIVTVSSLVTTFSIGSSVWRDVLRGRFATALLPRLRSFAIPLGATMFVGAMLQWADRFVLAGHVTAAELGVYSAAVDLTQQSLGLLGSSLYIAWFPRLVSAHEQRGAHERTTIQGNYLLLMMAVLLPAVIGFILVRTDLIVLFFGWAYVEHSSAIIPWVTLATVLGLLRTFVFDVGLYLTGRTRAQLRNVSVSAVIGVTLNLLCVPRYGIWAAVIAAVAAQSVALVLSWQSSRDVVAWRISWDQVVRILFSCGSMALMLFLIRPDGAVTLVIRIAAAATTYGAAMLIVNGAACRDWLTGRLQRHIASGAKQ